MNWEDERYVRLYTRDTVTWKMIGWQGRCLLPLLLRKLDRSGCIELEDAGAEGVAALVDVPVEVVEPGLNKMIERGVVQLRGAVLVFPKFLDAQEAKQSDRQRQQESRARRRASVLSEPESVTNRDRTSRSVTERHDLSHDVTGGHSVSHDVTLCSAVLSRAQHSTAEEILPGRSSPDPVREEHAGQGIGPSTGLSLAQGPAHQDPGTLPDADGDRGRDPGRGPAQASTDPGSRDRIGTQGGLPGLVPIAATQKPQKATRKPKPRGEEPPALTNATWAAYAAAFVRRHKTDPRRNRRVNGQLKAFIELVGAEDAPGIAAHYVANGSAFYVTQMHPVGLMLRDAEKLAAEWQRGDHVSAAQARRNEQTAANPFLNMPCREDGDE